MIKVCHFKNPPRATSKAWISLCGPYQLPEGLGNRWPVTVLAVGPEWCAVETADGRRWVIETVRLDFGRRFDIAGNGSKAPESHPAVLDYLEKRLRELRAQAKQLP